MCHLVDVQGIANFTQSSKATSKLNFSSIGHSNRLHVIFIFSYCLDNPVIPAF